MAGYVVGIASETKAFKQGVEVGIIKPIEDAEKALDDLGNARGPEQLERDLKDASKATDNLSDETKDTARTIEREYRDSFRKVKHDADDAFDGAKRGSQEFKDEARSTSREAAASFSEPADALDAIQELAANAFAGFGPVGAGVGLVSALGLGLVTSELQKQQKESDELKARLTGAYIAAAEEGRNYLDVQQIIEESAAIYQDAERLATATEDAARFSVDRSIVVQAMAGDEDALNTLIERGNGLREEELDKVKQSGETLEQQQPKIDGINAKYDTLIDKFDTQLGLQATLKQNAEEYAGLIDQQNSKQADGNKAALDAIDKRGAALQAYADRAGSIPNPVLVPDIDTSRADGILSEFIARRRSAIELNIFYKEQGRVIP